ncbi:MAG: hypothetical protein ACYC1D_06470 [Acidimicrobiales bacterium]
MHAHLAVAHPEQVQFERRGARQVYAIRCPICGADYDQTIKPRLDDPTFLEEFHHEIRLVAFDMMLSHLVGEHEPPAPSAEQ